MERTTWAKTVALRCQVLGWTAKRVAGDLDAETVHLAAIENHEEPVAVVSYELHPCPELPETPAVYLWAMAVTSMRQRTGIGRSLVGAVLTGARKIGAAAVWADARVTAVPFYRKCGASVTGQPYQDDITGLTDQRVIVELAPTP